MRLVYNRFCFEFRPQITEDELKMVRMAIQYELEDAQMKPDQEPLLLEAIHAAAYNRLVYIAINLSQLNS